MCMMHYDRSEPGIICTSERSLLGSDSGDDSVILPGVSEKPTNLTTFNRSIRELIPSTLYVAGMVAHVCSTSPKEAEAGDSGFNSRFKVSLGCMRFILRKRKKKQKEDSLV